MYTPVYRFIWFICIWIVHVSAIYTCTSITCTWYLVLLACMKTTQLKKHSCWFLTYGTPAGSLWIRCSFRTLNLPSWGSPRWSQGRVFAKIESNSKNLCLFNCKCAYCLRRSVPSGEKCEKCENVEICKSAKSKKPKNHPWQLWAGSFQVVMVDGYWGYG